MRARLRETIILCGILLICSSTAGRSVFGQYGPLFKLSYILDFLKVWSVTENPVQILQENVFLSFLFFSLFFFLQGQTCRGKCGEVLDTCSCRAACASLQTCCADFSQSCVQVMPHSSSMLGGRALKILALLLPPAEGLRCRLVSMKTR